MSNLKLKDIIIKAIRIKSEANTSVSLCLADYFYCRSKVQQMDYIEMGFLFDSIGESNGLSLMPYRQ